MSDFMQWVTHGIKRGRFEMDRRQAKYARILFLVLTMTAALYLTLVSRTAARGRRIQQLEVELFRLQREIEQLEVEIARDSSVPRLWERANELGFIPPEQVKFVYLSESQ
jgi:cell division protein FtsL